MHRLCTDAPKLNQEIDHIKNLINKLKEKNNISSVILFGSYARGDINENSDVDLLIVGDFKERYFDRIGKVLSLYGGQKDIEPFVYTDEEFDKMKKEKRVFIEEILKNGIKLIG